MGGFMSSQAGWDFWLQVSEPTEAWLAGWLAGWLAAELFKEEPREGE